MRINSKKITALFVSFLLITLSFTFQSCKKSRSDMGKTLFLKTKNKVFKNVTPEGFAEVFQKVLADEKSKLNYPHVISAYYEQNGYDPMLIMDHLFNGDLAQAATHFQKANEHGLDPAIFKGNEIADLINKFHNKKEIKTLDQAYHIMAELELLSANSLIAYSNDLQYGVVDPTKIYKRYFIETKQPDSVSMDHIFHVADIKTYLDSIQPKSLQYQVLQKAITSGYTAPGKSQEETRRILAVNLERLRWKNKPTATKYVMVNIAAFQLDVMEGEKSVLNMKVCVGKGRNAENAKTLMNYTDTDKVDNPDQHSTPQLSSLIHSVDVNPIWNIPQSIASKEIIKEAAKDRFYLENEDIEVTKNGKSVEPEDIDWSAVSTGESDYEFKQKPGDHNSLGKIKFMFKNKSSVYLHDTPVKSAFERPMRAISHGCVRLGDPQGLALNLFGPGSKYDMIVKYMGEDKPKPTTISLNPNVPVFITYMTSWADATGNIQVMPDVYGLDIVLYANLMNSH